jgi:hypothetical protein
MRLTDMKTKCRMCGRELIADTKDEEFASFYCMRCGVYTTRPLDEFKEPPKAVAEAMPKPADTKPQE